MYFITNRCKKGGVSENRSSFSLLFVVGQIRGGGTNSHEAVCTPPPLFFMTNYCKRAGTSENRSSFCILWVIVQIKGIKGGGYKWS